MDELKMKIKSINNALVTLKKAVNSYSKSLQKVDISCLLKEQLFDEYSDFIRSLRDSLIQRFEYCVDLFWKFLKFYLENIEKVTLEFKSPRGIIRKAAESRLITEDDAKLALEMIDYRNQSSHLYKEETADFISKKIPDFYLLMRKIVDTVTKN